MKKLSLIIFTLIFALITSCVIRSFSQVNPFISHPQTDSPIRTGFDDSHELDPDIPCILAHATVNRIWDGVYAIDDYPNSALIYVVAECTIDHIFYIGASPALPEEVPFVSEGTSCSIWFSLSDEVTAETNRELCNQFLESFDSFILYAHEGTPYYWSDSSLRKRVSKECGDLNNHPDSTFVVTPAIIVDDLLSWQIIPIKDGYVKTSIMQDFITDLYDDQYTMRFSLETSDPSNGQTFANGSSVDEMYTSLNKYVTEFSFGKEHIP